MVRILHQPTNWLRWNELKSLTLTFALKALNEALSIIAVETSRFIWVSNKCKQFSVNVGEMAFFWEFGSEEITKEGELLINIFFLRWCASQYGNVTALAMWVGLNKLPTCVHRWVIVDIGFAVILHTKADEIARWLCISFNFLLEHKKMAQAANSFIKFLSSMSQREQTLQKGSGSRCCCFSSDGSKASSVNVA